MRNDKNNFQNQDSDFQSPSDSFLRDLDINDWSMPSKEEEKAVSEHPEQEITTSSRQAKGLTIARVAVDKVVGSAKETRGGTVPGSVVLDSESTMLELADLEPSEHDKHNPFVRQRLNRDVVQKVVGEGHERRLDNVVEAYWWDKRSCIGIDPLNEELASQKWWREERGRVAAVASKGLEMLCRRRISSKGVREDEDVSFMRLNDQERRIGYVKDFYDNPGWSLGGLQAKRALFGCMNYDQSKLENRYSYGAITDPEIAEQVLSVNSASDLGKLLEHKPDEHTIDQLERVQRQKSRAIMSDEERYNCARLYAEDVFSDVDIQDVVKNQGYIPSKPGQHSDYDEMVAKSGVIIPEKYMRIADEKIEIGPASSDDEKHAHVRQAVEAMIIDLGLQEAIRLQYGKIPSDPDKKYRRYDKMVQDSGAVTPKRYVQLANDISQRHIVENLEAVRYMVDGVIAVTMPRIMDRDDNEPADTDARGGSDYPSELRGIAAILDMFSSRRLGGDELPILLPDFRTIGVNALYYFRKEEIKWGKQLAKVNEYRKQHQLDDAQRDEVLLELQKAYEVTAYYDAKVRKILGITGDSKQSAREYHMKTLVVDQMIKQIDDSGGYSVLEKWRKPLTYEQ